MASENYDCLKLENQLCFPLYAASKEVIRQYKPFLDAIDLTYTQYIAMMVMWEHKQVSVKELGSYLYLDSGTLTPLLKKMEDKGLVTRTKSDVDGRGLVVAITDKGEALKEQAAGIPASLRKCLTINQDESIQLYTLLQKILAGFKS